MKTVGLFFAGFPLMLFALVVYPFAYQNKSNRDYPEKGFWYNYNAAMNLVYETWCDSLELFKEKEKNVEL